MFLLRKMFHLGKLVMSITIWVIVSFIFSSNIFAQIDSTVSSDQKVEVESTIDVTVVQLIQAMEGERFVIYYDREKEIVGKVKIDSAGLDILTMDRNTMRKKFTTIKLSYSQIDSIKVVPRKRNITSYIIYAVGLPFAITGWVALPGLLF